jgi:predicted nucleic acid-binding protein
MRYANVPMALADACLVRMAEFLDEGIVLTVDSDFEIYRKNGRRAIPVLLPEER